MGDPFVGIVHPCKIYNILRLGIPFLYIGPVESHVTDLIPSGPPHGPQAWACCARHGDVDRAVSHILQAAATGPRRFDAESHLAEAFSQRRLLTQLVDVVATDGAGTPPTPVEPPTSLYADR